MNPQIRYQVFVSSTYDDLREERQQATQAILEAGHFPAGMELFPASDDAQWELIKRVIEESDYYVVIVAGRYGSIGRDGISFTEMEYHHAVEIGIPVLGFVRENIGAIASQKSEASEKNQKKLLQFRERVMSRSCRKFETPQELGMAVMKSLISETRIRPRIGWTRADLARSQEDIQRERQILEDLRQAEETIEQLERKIRDRQVLQEEIPLELFAQGDDEVELDVTFQDGKSKASIETVKLTWDEIFQSIGPTMYGYILRKTRPYGSDIDRYKFEAELCDAIRKKIIERVGNKKLRLQGSQIDAIVLQFKELGLIQYDETKAKDGSEFRGITLTPNGERKLTKLGAQMRKKDVN